MFTDAAKEENRKAKKKTVSGTKVKLRFFFCFKLRFIIAVCQLPREKKLVIFSSLNFRNIKHSCGQFVRIFAAA